MQVFFSAFFLSLYVKNNLFAVKDLEYLYTKDIVTEEFYSVVGIIWEIS